PERPIPSGAVSPSAALAVGGGVLGAGLALACRGGAARTGTALAGAVLAYNFGLKHGPAGPAAMGACRALSLLSGAEAAAGGRGVRSASRDALILGSYVAGLTLLARGETPEGGNQSALPGVVVAAAAAGAALARGGRRSAPWVLALTALAVGAARRAVESPAPSTVGPAVGAMIRALPALDAALAAPRAPVCAALVAAPLLALTRWG